eukprot:2989270-Amphidinium_carterae.1
MRRITTSRTTSATRKATYGNIPPEATNQQTLPNYTTTKAIETRRDNNDTKKKRTKNTMTTRMERVRTTTHSGKLQLHRRQDDLIQLALRAYNYWTVRQQLRNLYDCFDPYNFNDEQNQRQGRLPRQGVHHQNLLDYLVYYVPTLRQVSTTRTSSLRPRPLHSTTDLAEEQKELENDGLLKLYISMSHKTLKTC